MSDTKAKKAEAKQLVAEFIDAIAANQPTKVHSIGDKIDKWNRMGYGLGKAPLTAQKVNKAFESAKGDKDALRRMLKSPGSLSYLWSRSGGAKTRRSRTRRSRTRKNGF